MKSLWTFSISFGAPLNEYPFPLSLMFKMYVSPPVWIRPPVLPVDFPYLVALQHFSMTRIEAVFQMCMQCDSMWRLKNILHFVTNSYSNDNQRLFFFLTLATHWSHIFGILYNVTSSLFRIKDTKYSLFGQIMSESIILYIFFFFIFLKGISSRVTHPEVQMSHYVPYRVNHFLWYTIKLPKKSLMSLYPWKYSLFLSICKIC